MPNLLLTKRWKISTLIPYPLLVAAIILRPTFPGETISFIGSLIFFCCGILALSTVDFRSKEFQMLMLSQGSAILLWIFLVVHSAVNQVQSYFALSALIQIGSCCFGVISCFSNRDIHDRFFAIYRVYLCIHSISWIITVIFAIFIGTPALYIMSYESLHYVDVHELYFPFTTAYGFREFFGVLVPRLAAGFRESGIAQAFYATAILTLPSIRTVKDKIVLGLLVTGGLAALSTTGMAVVAVAFGIRLLQVGNLNPLLRIGMILVSIVICYMAVDVAINDDNVGFAAKENTDSYWDRKLQSDRGIDAFLENPMGYGAYSERVEGGINLVSSSGSIGIIGLVLVVVNLLASMFGSTEPFKKGLLLLPIFLTGLTSQPLLDAALVYVFFGFLGNRRP